MTSYVGVVVAANPFNGLIEWFQMMQAAGS